MTLYATGYEPVPPTGDPTPLGDVYGWRPRVAAGDFYIGDRHHYLFADKQTCWWEECRHSSYTLADSPVSRESMEVSVEGIPFSDFRISGQKISIVHPDPKAWAAMYDYAAWTAERWGWYKCCQAFDPEAAIQVTYSYLATGLGGTGILGTGTIMEQFDLKDCYEERFLPTEYFAPVIFTDDCIKPGNARDFTPEFSIDPITDQIYVNSADNRFLNPAFECVPYDSGCPLSTGYYPLGWNISPTGAGLLRVADAYYCNHVVVAEATGYCSQEVDVDPRLPHVASAWVRSRPMSTGVVANISVSFVDISGYVLDPSGMHLGLDVGCDVESVTQSIEPGYDWERIYLTMGDPTALYPSMHTPLPADTNSICVKLYASGTGQVEFDAAQMEVGYAPSQFSFVGYCSTLETEGNPTGIYQYDPESQAPFNQDDVDINSTRTEASRGFMSIGEYCADYHNEPVDKGGLSILSVPTGEFVVYRGTEYQEALQEFPVLITEPPKDYGAHYLDSYTSPEDQTTYALLDVGRTHADMHEYYSNITTPDGINYPNGIRDETWVGSDGVIDLNAGLYPWIDILRWRLQNRVFSVHGFDGIMYYNVEDGVGIPPYTDIQPQEELMAEAVERVHQWANLTYGTGFLLGISNGMDVFRREIYNAAWTLENLDSLMVDGLTITPAGVVNPNPVRNHTRAKVLHTTSSAADYMNMNFPVYALDYMNPWPSGVVGPAIDEELIKESRHYAHNECWKYYCGPTGMDEVWQLEGHMYNYYMPVDDDVPPCTGIGRMHTPWGLVSGYNKLRKRSTFHLENEPTNEDITSAKNASLPVSITVISDNSMYIDEEADVHVALDWESALRLEPVVKDTYGNYVDSERVYAAALYGLISPSWDYTNKSGAAVFTYTVGTGFPTGLPTGCGVGTDLVSFATRSPDVVSALYIDVVGCVPTGTGGIPEEGVLHYGGDGNGGGNGGWD